MRNTKFDLSFCLLLLSAQFSALAQDKPQVSVAEVLTMNVVSWKEFTGRLESPESAEIRPRVSGYVDEVLFVEGSLVKEGQVLFKLDDRAFKAEVNRLKAEQQVAESKYSLAQSEYQRAADLIQKSAISKEMLDVRKSQLNQTMSSIEAIKAAVELAELNLSYCSVESPITGRISKAIATKGNYVNAGDSILTSVVSTGKVYAYFDTDEQTYLSYVRQIRAGALPSAREVQYPVLMGLADDTEYPYHGLLDFIDNKVDPKTGTIKGRAVFDNSEGRLIPGLFARIKVVANASAERLLVLDKAILSDLNNKYVMVLDAEGLVQYRAVEIGERVEDLRIIEKGLTAKDQVVISGLQRIRPGSPVTAVKTAMASDELIAKIKKTQVVIADLKAAPANTAQ